MTRRLSCLRAACQWTRGSVDARAMLLGRVEQLMLTAATQLEQGRQSQVPGLRGHAAGLGSAVDPEVRPPRVHSAVAGAAAACAGVDTADTTEYAKHAAFRRDIGLLDTNGQWARSAELQALAKVAAAPLGLQPHLIAAPGFAARAGAVDRANQPLCRLLVQREGFCSAGNQ